MPGSQDPARALQPGPRPRPPGHLLPEPARPALTSGARGPGPSSAMLSSPGLSRSKARASAQVANVAAGAGRPRPGGSGYRPGLSPPSTHQASGSAKSPRLALWRETETLEGGNRHEPQGEEWSRTPSPTSGYPQVYSSVLKENSGCSFSPKVSPYSPSSLSPMPPPQLPSQAREEPNHTSHRIGRFLRRAPTQPAKPCQVLNQVLGLAPSLPLEIDHFSFYHPPVRVCSPLVALRLYLE